MIYPNLAEIIKYHPYDISTFADFADVTTEFMEAVTRSEKELTMQELYGIARYSSIPCSVLACPHLIRMDRFRYRHKVMVEELVNALSEIQEAQETGSREADSFMKYGRILVANLELAFLDGRATYGMYLGVQERVQQAISFIQNEKHKLRRDKDLKRKDEMDLLIHELVHELGEMSIEDLEALRPELIEKLRNEGMTEAVIVFLNTAFDLVINKKEEKRRAAV